MDKIHKKITFLIKLLSVYKLVHRKQFSIEKDICQKIFNGFPMDFSIERFFKDFLIEIFNRIF